MPPILPRGFVRKSFGADTEMLGDRQVRVRVSTEGVDRVGDVVVQKGIDTTNFMKSRTVLWNHDQDHPVAACRSLTNGLSGFEALCEFPEPGVSAKADEVYGLLKAGVINAASIGFLPLEVQPADGKAPRKGLRVQKADLMEFSFVSVPANPGAEVLQRAFGGAAARVPARKGLYNVSQLAFILHQLGFQVDAALDEAAREGDGSTVPAQLHQVLAQLGAVLVAMTQEEVAELVDKPGLGFVDPEGDLDALAELGDTIGLLSAPDGARKLVKAGRRFSAETRTTMKGHLDAIGTAHAAMCKMLREPDGVADDDDDGAIEKRSQRLRLMSLDDAATV